MIKKLLFSKNKLNLKLTNLFPYLAGSVLFIVTPLVLLFIKAFSNSHIVDKGAILRDTDMWYAILRSVTMALIASVFALGIAFPFTWVVARHDSPIFRVLSMMLMISPLFIFSVVKVFALKMLLMNIFDSSYLPPKQWIIVLGMVYIYTPYMMIPLYPVMRSFPNSLLDASNDLGYSTLKTVFKVILPYCLKSIFSGIAIVFIMSSTTLLMTNTLIDNGFSIEKVRMIANIIDHDAKGIDVSAYSETTTSTVALITLAVVMSIYGLIYLGPRVIRKLRGGIDV